MHRLEITQTNLAAIADPDDVVLRDELDDDLADDLLPAPPRLLRLEAIGDRGERSPAPAVIERPARLAIEVPAGAERLVLVALDPEGQVVASRELGLGTAMTAEVFLDLLAAGLESEGLEAVDLHVRITPEVAAALSAAARKAVEACRPRPRALPSIPIATAPRRR